MAEAPQRGADEVTLRLRLREACRGASKRFSKNNNSGEANAAFTTAMASLRGRGGRCHVTVVTGELARKDKTSFEFRVSGFGFPDCVRLHCAKVEDRFARMTRMGRMRVDYRL